MKSFENCFETPNFHARYDWKITFSRLGTKLFFKKGSVLFFKKCRIVPKNEKGTLWESLTYILLQNIKKKLEGGLFWDIKKFQKKPHSGE